MAKKVPDPVVKAYAYQGIRHIVEITDGQDAGAVFTLTEEEFGERFGREHFNEPKCMDCGVRSASLSHKGRCRACLEQRKEELLEKLRAARARSTAAVSR